MWTGYVLINSARVDAEIDAAQVIVGDKDWPERDLGAGASWTFEVQADDHVEAVSEALRRTAAELGGRDAMEMMIDAGDLTVRVSQSA